MTAMIIAFIGQYSLLFADTLITSANPPEKVQNGPPSETRYAAIKPPNRVIRKLNVIAERLVGAR